MIEIDPPDEASRRLWHAVSDLVELLPQDWTLVGGLMVQLHAFEHGVPDVRVTFDIDAPRPGTSETQSAAGKRLGADRGELRCPPV